MGKAIIFDLDGVLVHTDNYHYMAWKELSNFIGVKFNRDINDRCRGVSRMQSLEIILENCNEIYSVEEKKQFIDFKNRTYQMLLSTMKSSDVDPGIRETLTSLLNAGYKLAVGSSSCNAPLILGKADLIKYFDAVVDGNSINNTKPDPEVFLKAAKMLGVKPEQCAIVEDAPAGVEAGMRAGMLTVAIGPAIPAEDVDIKIDEISELLRYFPVNQKSGEMM